MGTISLIRYADQKVYSVSNTLQNRNCEHRPQHKYTKQLKTQDYEPHKRTEKGRQNPIKCGKCSRLRHLTENCYSKIKISFIMDAPTETEGYNTIRDEEEFYSDICTINRRSENSRYFTHGLLSHSGRNPGPTIHTNITALIDSGANCKVANKPLISDSIGLTLTQTTQANGTVMSGTIPTNKPFTLSFTDKNNKTITTEEPCLVSDSIK
jgi:hypothetical protein